MKKPFIVIDFADKEILVIVNTYCKTIGFGEIEKNEDFFYELFRRYKEINFVSKYAEMGKKDFLKLIEDLSEAIKEEVKEEVKGSILAFQDDDTEKFEEKEEEEELRYLMSNTDKRFSIDDLGIVFSHRAENYEIKLIGEDKVNKSEYLKVFIEKGLVVKATASMVRKEQGAYLKKSRSTRSKTGGLQIVDREGVDVSGDISGVSEMELTGENMNDDFGADDGSGIEYDAFANTTGDKSLDAIMKKMKS
jgi:hypothetical protein